MRSNVSLRSCISCLFAVGILTGCTSLVTTFERIRAEMIKDETPEESHYYGAFFIWSLPGETCRRPGGNESADRRLGVSAYLSGKSAH